MSNIEAVSQFGLGQLWEGMLDLIIQGHPPYIQHVGGADGNHNLIMVLSQSDDN